MKLKKPGKSLPAARLESVAFGFVVRCLTDGAIRLHIFNGIFNKYREGKQFYGFWEKFTLNYIEFFSTPMQAYFLLSGE